jgi:hypothetical protein
MNVKYILYYVAKNEMDANFPLYFIGFIISAILFASSIIQINNDDDESNLKFIITYCIFWISCAISYIITVLRIIKHIPNELFFTSKEHKCLRIILWISDNIFWLTCIVAIGLHIFHSYDYLFIVPLMCIFMMITTHIKRLEIERKIFFNEEYIRKYDDCINNLLIEGGNMPEFMLIFKKYEVYLRESQNPITSCVICLEDFKNTDNITILQCDHIYHYNCVSGWFMRKPNCPICRTDIIEMA